MDRAPAETAPGANAAGRRADIQGLRAVAVLLVVAFHSRLPVPGGFVGVDVFFVISGFVITCMLLREWVGTGAVALRQFYFRRFLRLTPALALTVTLVALASIVLQSPFGPQQATASTGAGAMLLSANFVIAHAAGDYFADSATLNPLLNTWSLSVEEQFYLLFPALLVLGWTVARRTGRERLPALFAVLGLAIASFAGSVTLDYGPSTWLSSSEFFGGPASFAFYSSLTRAWEFAVGAFLGLSLARLPQVSPGATHAAGLLGTALIAASALGIDASMTFPGLVVLVPVLGTALLLIAGAQRPVGVSRLLALRPMVAIGDASYSWYLWHWPVIVFSVLLVPNKALVPPIAAVVALVPAMLSYRFVEQPIRAFRPRTRWLATALVLCTVGVPLAVSGVLQAGATRRWGLGTVPRVSDAASGTSGAEGSLGDGDGARGDGSMRSQHAVVDAGCVNIALNPGKCRFGPTSPVGSVLLAGDSQAYAVADGTIAAATRLGFDTVVTTHTGCPFLGRESSGSHDHPCRAWQKAVLAYALDTPPGVVVISNRSAGYVHPEWGWRTVATDHHGRAASIADAAALWRRGLEPVVSALTAAGIPVVIIDAAPEMHGYTDGTSLFSNVFGIPDFEVSRAGSEADRAPALEVEQAIARAHPGALTFDPYPALCDDATCAAARSGVARYQDETHLSVAGSMMLTDGVEASLRQALSERWAARPDGAGGVRSRAPK